MVLNSEGDNYSSDEWVKRVFVDYELDAQTRKNIAQIKKNVLENAYVEKKNCFAHMEYVEKLANKIRNVLQNEQSLGQENFDVQKAYKEVLNLYQELADIHQRL